MVIIIINLLPHAKIYIYITPVENYLNTCSHMLSVDTPKVDGEYENTLFQTHTGAVEAGD